MDSHEAEFLLYICRYTVDRVGARELLPCHWTDPHEWPPANVLYRCCIYCSTPVCPTYLVSLLPTFISSWSEYRVSRSLSLVGSDALSPRLYRAKPTLGDADGDKDIDKLELRLGDLETDGLGERLMERLGDKLIEDEGVADMERLGLGLGESEKDKDGDNDGERLNESDGLRLMESDGLSDGERDKDEDADKDGDGLSDELGEGEILEDTEELALVPSWSIILSPVSSSR